MRLQIDYGGARGRPVALYPTTPPPPDRRFAPSPVEICQLAGTWSPRALAPGWQVEEKHDGIRCLWFDGQLWTREGEALDLPHIAAEAARLERRFGQPMFLDGEYVEPGGFHATLSVIGSRGKRAATGTFHVFDAVPLGEWRADACEKPLTARQALLRLAVGDWSPRALRIVQPRPVANGADVERIAAGIWAAAGEGVIAKDGASLYRRHRSDTWLKLKRELRLVAEIIAVMGDGAAAAVMLHGKRCKIAVPPGLRDRVAVGMTGDIVAMEFTAKGALRQGRLAAIAT
jgi:ATP-dependent DNA ligase